MAMPRPGADFDESGHPPAPASHPLLAAAAPATLWGFDYAWQGDTPAQLVRLLQANGAAFAARYINDGVPGGKGLTQAEAAALEAAGIIICPVYETTGTDFTGGYSAGVTAGRAGAADMAARGAPAGSLCWFAIDTGTSDFRSTNSYLRGCKDGSGVYIAQLYGHAGVCDAAASAGLGGLHWQTYAWSAGAVSANALLYQYQNGVMIGGISMDRDRTLKPLSGPWAHSGSTPPSDWTEQMIMALPTLGPSDTDQALGGALLVHRVQLLVSGIGKWNGLGPVTVLTADGIYGPATIAAVKAVQKFFGLSQDGITGPATWHHLVTGG